MLKLISTITLLFTASSAQGSGHGISKFTRAQSDPITCLAFFNDILGGSTASSECPNNKCECATQGRSQICAQSPQHGGHQQTFGAHAINCTYHPYGEWSLGHTEKLVDQEIDWTSYNQFMDSHAGIWTNDLSGYVSKLNAAGHKMIKMSWSGNKQYSDRIYYSVLTEACPGFFFELISDDSSGLKTDEFKFVEEPRLDFTRWQTPSTEYDTIVKVSRATTKNTEMIDFYTNVIGGSVLLNEMLDDGTEWTVVKLDYAQAQLHFVNRPASEGASFTVDQLEAYVNSVHDQYIKSTNCGFDQYADHHWAYDSQAQGFDLSTISKKLEAGGYKYRWFSLPQNQYQIYAFDPSGWTLQLDLQTGSNPPSTAASYSAACKSNDGCYGQGLCDDTVDGHFYYATKSWEFFLQ